jgi:hypothetical protein
MQDGKQGGITPFQAKGGNHTNLLHVAAINEEQKNWPTPNAQVSQDGESPETWLKRKEAMRAKGYNGNGCGTPLTIAVQLHGQADPASSNSHGSRQGLWLTPRANEPDSDPNFAARNADRGAHCHGTLSSQAKEMWPTITAHTPDMESNGPNGHQGTYLAGAVKQWATPAAFDWNTAENKAAWEKRAAEQKSKGVNLHLPLKSQAVHEAEKQWATPKTPTGGPETAKRKQELGRTASGGGDLASQALEQWPTPMTLSGPSETANVSGSSQFTRTMDVKLGYRDSVNAKRSPQAGKLNPRWVETLMGLPIGWTMPSCTSPQTIAPMSCDSSATALCRPPQSELLELFFQS